MRPRLLDLFCGAGGAAMGYHRAGFEVVGVDLEPQPRYPFELHQADAMTFPLDGFDAVHASPPCQNDSAYRRRPGHVRPVPMLIERTRARFLVNRVPLWVIENVPGAPLHHPIRLCGSSFGLDVRRHRLFEISAPPLAPPCDHGWQTPRFPPATNRRNLRRTVEVGVWRIPLETQQRAMGIDWMTLPELSQAIPPAYTEWIGAHLLAGDRREGSVMGLVGFRSQNHPQQTTKRGPRDSIDDRGTDPALFAELHARFGFTLDVAASSANAKCERFYSIEDDGLYESWADERVWCNPPYSDLAAWTSKAWAAWEEEGAELIVMLVPASRTEQAWWQDNVEPYRDRHGGPLTVEFLRGRRRFVRAGAEGIGPNERPPFGSCLLIWQPIRRGVSDVEEGLETFEQAFLSHMVDPSSDRTLWQAVREPIEEGAFRLGGPGLKALGPGGGT